MSSSRREVLKYVSIEIDCSTSRRKQHLKQKYLCLGLCKFPEIDSEKFGIGLNLYHFMRFEKGRMVFDYSFNSSRIGQTTKGWNNKMYEWSHYQWALFIINICKQIKFRNIIQIHLSYKFITIPSSDCLQIFIQGIQTEFDKLLKKNKFMRVFEHEKISLIFDSSFHFDPIVNFDIDPFNIYHPLCARYGFYINKSQTPAAKYGLLGGSIVVDYYGNRYKSHKEYIVKRILDAKRNHNIIINNNDIMSANCIYRFLCEINKIRSSIGNGIELGSQIRKRLLFSPKTTLNIYFLPDMDGVPMLPMPLLKHCKVCEVIIERHRKYISKELLKTGKLRFAKKMYRCKCSNLMVCSRRCYKIAWSRHDHRLTCSHC
eukprot:445223_1